MRNVFSKGVKSLLAVGAFTGLTSVAEAGSKFKAVDAEKAAQAQQSGRTVVALTQAEYNQCQQVAKDMDKMSRAQLDKMWASYFAGEIEESTAKCMGLIWKAGLGYQNAGSGKDGKGSGILVEVIPEFKTELERAEYERQREVRGFVSLGVIHVGEHTAPMVEAGLEVAREINDRGTSVVMGVKGGIAVDKSNGKTQTWDSGLAGWDFQATYVMPEAQWAMVFAAIEQKAGPVTMRVGGQIGYMHTLEAMEDVKAIGYGQTVNYPDYKGEFEREGIAAGVNGMIGLDVGEALRHQELKGVNIGIEGSANWMLNGEDDYKKHGKDGEMIGTLGLRLTIPFGESSSTAPVQDDDYSPMK